MNETRTPPTDRAALDQFTAIAERAASGVIRSYSTSFGLASRLLGARHRQHVRNVYAMVRIADEIVDGVAAQAGLTPADQHAALTEYAEQTHRAMRSGYSSNIVLHAFARTARASGIDTDLTQPFFSSMQDDLDGSDASPTQLRTHDAASHARYVHGSAEVVGLMCLRIFLRNTPVSATEDAALVHGAQQLGAAFQNVNFLRDLADDTDRLRRGYLSGDGCLTAAQRDEWVRIIRQQLDDADQSIPLLPRDARAAVRSAHGLFAALTDRVAHTPVEVLYRQRVRVPDAQKAAIAARALITTTRERA
ncbi:phytoene/squalene synthase family protein [Microbacterium sp. GXS0129]|uniref:phytoene/squalene synthase family protein n=1 Tax=Microbacterium sp. GXS0129 TaxID=3377836 RepID=UPI00383A2AE5